MLPEQDWLAQAKRLAIGMRVRVRHRNESRPNMVIANEKDKWWAFCQRCHEGAVVQKEHVLFGTSVTKADDILVPPTDLQRVWNSEYEEVVERFLISKNMASEYLPELWYSPSRKRVLVHEHGWHGRDVTGKAPAKWMNYTGDHIVGVVGNVAVVVEDLFSYFKTKWALRESKYSVVCALGTQDKPALIQHLMRCDEVLWFFDADRAGDDGADAGIKRLRPFVSRQSRIRPPEGLDPKDISIAHIRALILKGV